MKRTVSDYLTTAPTSTHLCIAIVTVRSSYNLPNSNIIKARFRRISRGDFSQSGLNNGIKLTLPIANGSVKQCIESPEKIQEK